MRVVHDSTDTEKGGAWLSPRRHSPATPNGATTLNSELDSDPSHKGWATKPAWLDRE